MKYEAKKIMSIIYLETTLNIEWGQIDPKGNRRVNSVKYHRAENMIKDQMFCCSCTHTTCTGKFCHKLLVALWSKYFPLN